ncbi:hypothetical protein O3Q52_21650 [Streptomyces sp. ActVer]|uniref:hypothetical protein n=1 Tax=Streptomyces sp. ActVer TaxID=3014558 RepID=UPI0022B3E734|nr:hypothetical protein [Streptomyces sp. ActVer]MCZ4510746.1 hypothetical protein [Streptomyces sp. ActVer]
MVGAVISDIARSIRPYLAGLIGERAGEVDGGIVALLAEARAGVDVEDRILALLATHPETHVWASAMLEDEDHLPPDVKKIVTVTREGARYGPLSNPLGGDPVDACRYSCPRDHAYVWWRMTVTQQVPHCPDHPGVPLEAD